MVYLDDIDHGVGRFIQRLCRTAANQHHRKQFEFG
jgi:hypothetical protein